RVMMTGRRRLSHGHTGNDDTLVARRSFLNSGRQKCRPSLVGTGMLARIRVITMLLPSGLSRRMVRMTKRVSSLPDQGRGLLAWGSGLPAVLKRAFAGAGRACSFLDFALSR